MTLSKSSLSLISTLLVGSCFILLLHFKWSYSVLPLALSVIGLYLIYNSSNRKQLIDKQDKFLIISVIIYFLLFVISLITHGGKMNELDLPSRLVLMLPFLIVCSQLKLKQIWILYSLIIACLVASIVGLIQFFGLKLFHIFPAYMYIQAGDILLTLSLLVFALAFYFIGQARKKLVIFCFLVSGLAMVVCFLTQARGAWVALPFMIGVILWSYRQYLSKWIAIFLTVVALIATVVAGNVIHKRWNQASNDIYQYVEKNNSNSSLGARFDMWKSAWLGIQEKPLMGWGLQGVKEMRKQHIQQKLVHKVIARFDHAHNQYLQDASARGVLGLLALLAIFLLPLFFFWQNLRQSDKTSLTYLWGVLGIVHILATMIYCLSQSFLSHNSGMMFYGFVLILCYGLQKISQKRPLAE